MLFYILLTIQEANRCKTVLSDTFIWNYKIVCVCVYLKSFIHIPSLWLNIIHIISAFLIFSHLETIIVQTLKPNLFLLHQPPTLEAKC